MRKERKKPHPNERRWFNMCQNSNDIEEIALISRIQEHPSKDILILSRLFASFYSHYTAAGQGTKIARMDAMKKMLDVLNNIETYWNKEKV